MANEGCEVRYVPYHPVWCPAPGPPGL